MEIRRKRCSASDGMLIPTVKFDIFITISHLGVHKIRTTGVLNNANALPLGTVSKKWNMATLDSAHQVKKQCNFDSG